MKINQILSESTRLDPKCWSGKKIGNPKTKMKDGVRVNNCVPKEDVSEDESKLYKHHQNLRKKSGLPDPDVYRQMMKQKQDEIDALNAEISAEKDKQDVAEEWSKKYKRSIDCNNPKGFSQKAHCAGKKKHNESFNGEYDDESGMAETNLHTIIRAAEGLLDTIDDNENLPEWVQEKIAKVEGMIVSSWDYLISQEKRGIDPRIEEDAKGYKSPSGGLTKKGRDHYNRTTGSNLKAPVTTKPSKLKPGSKAANRRKSFCARMSGVKGPMKDEKGRPTRKALALKKWNC